MKSTIVFTMFLLCIFQISNLGDIFDWLEIIIVPNVYPITTYNNQYLSTSDKLFVSNMYNLRLGPIFLRQKRVKKGEL